MSAPRRKLTAILTASSSRRRPHDVIGMAWSQSALCFDAAARSLALP